MKDLLSTDNIWGRISVVILISISAHILVIVIKKISRGVLKSISDKSVAKLMSVISLFTSILIFIIYFIAVGYVLKALGISLTAYVASASVIGLAVGFGSQGMVQDMVTGFTLIVSNLIDIGEMVEINGQVGIVKSIGMRFVVIRNAIGAEVNFPNRNINIVINYIKGYISCIVDILLPDKTHDMKSFNDMINKSVKSVFERYPNIFTESKTVEKILKTSSGKDFKRIIFKIWPGRGAPIENTFRQELLQAFKALYSNYADWMISVYYEIDKEKVR